MLQQKQTIEPTPWLLLFFLLQMLGVCVLIQANVSLQPDRTAVSYVEFEQTLVADDCSMMNNGIGGGPKRVSREKVVAAAEALLNPALRLLVLNLLKHEEALFFEPP